MWARAAHVGLYWPLLTREIVGLTRARVRVYRISAWIYRVEFAVPQPYIGADRGATRRDFS